VTSSTTNINDFRSCRAPVNLLVLIIFKCISIHKRRLWGDSPDARLSIIEKHPCIYQFLPYFLPHPKNFFGPANIFDKSTSVFYLPVASALFNLTSFGMSVIILW